MGPWHLIVLNLVLALVAVAVVLLSVRAFLRRHPEKADAKHGRAKLVVFNLILAFVVIAVAELSVLTFLRRDPPPTIESLTAKMEVPDRVSLHDMKDTICERFQTSFDDFYGIALEEDEVAVFSKLADGVDETFELTPYLRAVIEHECRRRKVPMSIFVRQAMLVRDPGELDKMRSEWVAAAEAALMDSADYHAAAEPVYREFFDWWTQRHPEYEGLVAPVSVRADHDGRVEQRAVSMRREVLVRTARQMQASFVTDLRKRGIVISEAKLGKAFLLFLALGKERYTPEVMTKTANAIIESAELTDDEVLHCLILKNRPLTEERLTTIQETQVRYLTPVSISDIPDESVAEVRRQLQELSGVAYGQQ